MGYDICVNLLSDFIFVAVLLILIWILQRNDLAKATSFFGLERTNAIEIYVSTHSDETTNTKQVVTAQEYEAAVELRTALQQAVGIGFTNRVRKLFSGLIGYEAHFPEPIIKLSPLEPVQDSVYSGSYVLIGGPVRNQLTKYYQDQAQPPIIFADGGFHILRGQTYEKVDQSDKRALLEKLKFKETTVILVYGYGEKGTKVATEYLINNWQRLDKEHHKQTFGLLFLIDDTGEILDEMDVGGNHASKSLK